MSAHTPGPWSVVQNWRGKLAIVGPRNNDDTTTRDRICNCPGGPASSNPKIAARGMANARLIAAAPVTADAARAMLAALKAIVPCVDDEEDRFLTEKKAAHAAIAQAEAAGITTGEDDD